MGTLGTIFGLGFLANFLKGLLAFVFIWVFVRLADRAMGINMNEKINNLEGTGLGMYLGLRLVAVALILFGVFL